MNKALAQYMNARSKIYAVESFMLFFFLGSIDSY